MCIDFVNIRKRKVVKLLFLKDKLLTVTVYSSHLKFIGIKSVLKGNIRIMKIDSNELKIIIKKG